MTARRIGLLGGTFDPIHAGHVDLARACASEVGLDEVRFVPNARPPHKEAARTSGHHRHAMAALAAAGDPLLVADPCELERPGPSYTIDTLEAFREQRPGALLFFLVGADSLRDLDSWHRWRDVLDAAVLVATARAGVDLAPVLERRREDIRAGRILVVRHEPPAWRSRDLREAIAAGRTPDGALPDLVAEYVHEHHLYREPAPSGAQRSST